ncbi:MAG: hypothetical protein V4449_01760 [Patescibacteria group bacterium]
MPEPGQYETPQPLPIPQGPWPVREVPGDPDDGDDEKEKKPRYIH